MKEALLWKALDQDKVQCRLCNQFCIIEPDHWGKCGVRENRGGKLYTLVYDRVAAANLDPVEKKPIYHFYPGTRTFSFGTPGCNMACSFCQNADLSQAPKESHLVRGQTTTPEQLVQAALTQKAHSISYTYSEPTIFFELMLDTAQLARENGLKNIMVSNGFQSPQCLDELGPHIDAANIDLKAFTDDFYSQRCDARLEPVLKNLKHIRELGWWLEVTTLLIPGLNDSDEELTGLSGFIAKELGPGTPWHVSRFHPQYRLTDRESTQVATLEKAVRIGREQGLEYVYIGNVPGHPDDDTRCHSCSAPLIRRRGFSVAANNVRDGKCRECGAEIPGVGLG